MWVKRRFISFDETPVFYRYLALDGDARGVVIIVHGMGEHGGRYRLLAEHLASKGFESWMPDLRGFGQSGGERGCVHSFSDFHRDLSALHSLARKNHPESTPFFFLGHSFGGLVSASYLALCQPPPVKGLVLTSPIFGVGTPVPAWRHAIGVASSYLIPDYRQSTGVLPQNLTHDAGILAVYSKDKLIHHEISSRLYRELVKMMNCRAEIAQRITCPVLVLQAGDDVIVSPKMSRLFFDELKVPDKDWTLYPGYYHEILNETGRQEVFRRIDAWLCSHLT